MLIATDSSSSPTQTAFFFPKQPLENQFANEASKKFYSQSDNMQQSQKGGALC